jgi:hypothetical protein
MVHRVGSVTCSSVNEPVSATTTDTGSSRTVTGEIRVRAPAGGRYLPLMFTTHALTTTAQTPVARGSLQSIRLRFRRPALERAAA